MTFLSTYLPVSIKKPKSTASSSNFVTISSSIYRRDCVIVEEMTSSYKSIARGSTTLTTQEAEIEAIWDRILSFAGAWEGEEEALTIEGLEELRRNVWGNRLDAFDEDEEQEDPS